MIQKVDGVVEGRPLIVRADDIRTMLDRKMNLIEFFVEKKRPVEETGKSLPLGSYFWAVPKSALLVAETDAESDLFNWASKDLPLDESVTLINKSGWDHTVWSVEGKQLLLPISLTLWGTRFNLTQVEAHLKDLAHPAVISFEIRRNNCSQNYGISGYHQGHLVLNVSKLEGLKECLGPLSRSDIERHVINNFEPPHMDLLGLDPFRITEQDSDSEDDQ